MARKTRKTAPKFLNDIASARWEQLYPLVAPAQHDLLTVYCTTYAEWHHAQQQCDALGLIVKNPAGQVVTSPWVTVRNNAAQTLQRLSKDLGIIDDDPMLPPEPSEADSVNIHAKYNLSDEQIIAVLRKTGGIITEAARAIGVGRTFFYENYWKREAVQAYLPNIRSELVDVAEGNIWRLVKAGDKDVLRYVMRCFGGDRGFIERSRVENTGPGGGPIATENVNANVHAAVSPEKFKELAKEVLGKI